MIIILLILLVVGLNYLKRKDIISEKLYRILVIITLVYLGITLITMICSLLSLNEWASRTLMHTQNLLQNSYPIHLS